jgi:hypothetical protein
MIEKNPKKTGEKQETTEIKTTQDQKRQDRHNSKHHETRQDKYKTKQGMIDKNKTGNTTLWTKENGRNDKKL